MSNSQEMKNLLKRENLIYLCKFHHSTKSWHSSYRLNQPAFVFKGRQAIFAAITAEIRQRTVFPASELENLF